MVMPPSRKDRCGVRLHRHGADRDVCPAHDEDALGLTPLGHALLEALRDDPRYREIIADPFGDDAGRAA